MFGEIALYPIFDGMVAGLRSRNRFVLVSMDYEFEFEFESEIRPIRGTSLPPIAFVFCDRCCTVKETTVRTVRYGSVLFMMTEKLNR